MRALFPVEYDVLATIEGETLRACNCADPLHRPIMTPDVYSIAEKLVKRGLAFWWACGTVEGRYTVEHLRVTERGRLALRIHRTAFPWS